MDGLARRGLADAYIYIYILLTRVMVVVVEGGGRSWPTIPAAVVVGGGERTRSSDGCGGGRW